MICWFSHALFFHFRYIWGYEGNEKIPKNIDKMTLIRVLTSATAPLHGLDDYYVTWKAGLIDEGSTTGSALLFCDEPA